MKDILNRIFLIVFNIVKSLFSLYTYFFRKNTWNDNRIYNLCNHTFVILNQEARLSSLAFLKAKLHKLHLLSDQLDILLFFTYN